MDHATTESLVQPWIQLGSGPRNGNLLMLLVALQVGLQPAVTRACVSSIVSGQSLVLVEIFVSMTVAITLTPGSAFSTWSVVESFTLVGPAALVYAARSLFKQAAYRRCDGVTFNVINQTKVVFCAVAAWFLMREKQNTRQCLALFCAVIAGALLVIPAGWLTSLRGKLRGTGSPKVAPSPNESGRRDPPKDKTTCNSRKEAEKEGTEDASAVESVVDVGPFSSNSGAALALATATCSGVAAALSQVAMRRSSRPSTLFNFELSLWGAPFAVVAGGTALPSQMLRGWSFATLAPVALQAAGGLMVSCVVQQKGGVAMGLCTVAGIGVSAVIDATLNRRLPRLAQIVASSLAALSIYVHQLD